MSPFFHDMMRSEEFISRMSEICGERVYPHFYLFNAQLNVGKVGKAEKVDQWHFDSVKFVCVTILSEIDGMIGQCIT